MAHAQTVAPGLIARDTTTTVSPGAAADFSGASYTYANNVSLDAVAGTNSLTLSVQPNAMNLDFHGLGGTTVTPPTAPDGTTSVALSSVSPGGTGQGIFFGYNAGATGFLNPTIIGGRYALAFNGGGTAFLDIGGAFTSTVNILGDWYAASSHTMPTFGAGYTVLDNFTFSGGYTHFQVTQNNYNGTSPTISFALLGASAPAVPEPASWALMIGGMGLVGTAMRRHRAGAALAAA